MVINHMLTSVITQIMGKFEILQKVNPQRLVVIFLMPCTVRLSVHKMQHPVDYTNEGNTTILLYNNEYECC